MFIPDTLLHMIIYMIKLVSVPVQLYRECPRTFLTTLVHIYFFFILTSNTNTILNLNIITFTHSEYLDQLGHLLSLIGLRPQFSLQKKKTLLRLGKYPG